MKQNERISAYSPNLLLSRRIEERHHSSLIGGLKEALPFVLIAIVLIIAFFYQCFVSRPYIMVDKIEMNGRNPFNHEFIIKNTGMTKAYNLNISLLSPKILTEKGLYIGTYDDTSKDDPLSDLSKIEGVKIPSQQTFSFTPGSLIFFPEGSRPKEAVVTIKFKYSDFLRFVVHEDRVSYRLIRERGYLIWKPVKPSYLSLEEQER